MRENDRNGRWCGFGEVGMGVIRERMWEMGASYGECNERGCGKGGCEKVG